MSNRNSNVTVTIHTTDGRTIVLRHRNSLGGWASALERAGLTIHDVDHTTAGLPDEDRVSKAAVEQRMHDASWLAAG